LSDYILHEFFRSSASFRVRAALKLKGIDYAHRSYKLRAKEQQTDAFRALNPQALVPTLQTPDGPIGQSLAIIEWLDETHPAPPLLPPDPRGRARVRGLAYMVAMEIHPLNNLRVLQHVAGELGQGEAGMANWFRHWVAQTFPALEARLAGEPDTGRYCHGDRPGLADLCLAAQVMNNRRFDIPLDDYPIIARIYDALMALPAFAESLPENQPDAV
jgi:maleylpyruvate isomerase